ncbi:MAG: hypothetical protein ACREEB_15790 [Caulobacteraceae bacterium]
MSALRNIVLSAALFTGAATLATAAFASTAQLSDSQFIAAARCQGLFDSHALGSVDASGINALMKSEGAYRVPEVSDRADEARNHAQNLASHASPAERSELISERDGACQVWAKAGGEGMAGR